MQQINGIKKIMLFNKMIIVVNMDLFTRVNGQEDGINMDVRKYVKSVNKDIILILITFVKLYPKDVFL